MSIHKCRNSNSTTQLNSLICFSVNTKIQQNRMFEILELSWLIPCCFSGGVHSTHWWWKSDMWVSWLNSLNRCADEFKIVARHVVLRVCIRKEFRISDHSWDNKPLHFQKWKEYYIFMHHQGNYWFWTGWKKRRIIMYCLESLSYSTGSSVPWRQNRTVPGATHSRWNAGCVQFMKGNIHLRPLEEVKKTHNHKSNTYILHVLHSKHWIFQHWKRGVSLSRMLNDRSAGEEVVQYNLRPLAK